MGGSTSILSIMDEENYYVELSKNPIRFEPVSKITNVFFDESNKQVFAVRSGGATGVVIKGPDERTSKNFRMEDRGEVISIKFNNSMKILAIQRSPKSVEFLNFTDGVESIDPVEYSQSCKGKSTRILGFNWVLPSDIVFITDNGIEYYSVIAEKRSLKALKAYSVPVNWFVWMPETSTLLLSSGTVGHVIHPFYFKNGSMVKLSKFEIDLPVIPKPPKLTLLERDVTMSNIYGNLYVVVLRHQAKGGQQGGAEVALYQLQKEGPAKKSDVLRLGMSGRFAINIVDNVILVHHQASKATMVFDIGLAGESDGYVVYHHPILPPLPIKPFKLNLPVVPGSGVTGPTQEFNCELYSPHWIVFQPNIVIDAKIGCLWYLQLRLDPLIAMMPNKARLVDFLLLRQDSKRVVLTVCRQMLAPGQQTSLQVIARVYDRLNSVLWNYHEADTQPVAVGNWGTDWRKNRKQVIIDQSDMYTHVFSIFSDSKDIHYKFMVAVLVEYIRSLNQFQIPVQHYLYELVINVLVQNNCFYQLHQFLQYHVLSDSKPLACLLLSLEGVYPPAHQLALDMLKRLSTANEEIVEVLLSKQAVLPALRFLRSVGLADTIPARKFLEAAKTAQDDMLYHTVFKFFEQRNARLRGSSQFTQGEHCDQYVEKFVELFGQEALASES